MTAQKALPGGTLSYNSRGQATGNYPFAAANADKTKIEDPYALIYVNSDDLGTDGKLLGDRRIEPLILRANAGDWIKVNLYNKFDTDAKTFTGGANISTFAAGNPFIRLQQAAGGTALSVGTSTSVGIHPQLVDYDITAGDGMNVGFNPKATIASKDNQPLYWYAGTLSFDEAGALVQTPVELGSVALAPADPLIQHTKGLLGALVVEPMGSTWPMTPDQLETVAEYENVYDADGNVTQVYAVPRKTRAVATVKKADGTSFRELALVMQTDALMYQSLQQGSSKPVSPPPLLFTNGPALNYRTEPLGYRYADGFAGNPFGGSYPAGTAARLSNGLVTPQLAGFQPQMADPQTPLLTARAGTPVRFRWVYPVGPGGDAGGSSQVPAVHGHVFQEEPYVNDSKELGFNPLSEWMGGRFILPGQTIDMLFPSAGGSFQIPGDYFYGTFIGQTSGGGTTQALWGLFRVTQ